MKRTLKNRNKGGNPIIGMIVPALSMLTGAVFLYAGISRGEMDVVLRKAINICLECIGIG